MKFVMDGWMNELINFVMGGEWIKLFIDGWMDEYMNY